MANSTETIRKKGWLSPSAKENLKIYRYKFSRNKLSVFGLILVLISLFFAIFAEMIVPYPESIGSFVDYANASLPPGGSHLFLSMTGMPVFCGESPHRRSYRHHEV